MSATKYDVVITTDGSYYTPSFGGYAFSLDMGGGVCQGQYWATRRETGSRSVELKGILAGLTTLLAGATTALGNGNSSPARCAVLYTDCLDAILEIELFEKGHHGAIEHVQWKSAGRVTSVIHVGVVEAIADAKRDLLQLGVHVEIQHQGRVLTPAARAADHWARAGANLAQLRVGMGGLNWPIEVHAPPQAF